MHHTTPTCMQILIGNDQLERNLGTDWQFKAHLRHIVIHEELLVGFWCQSAALKTMTFQSGQCTHHLQRSPCHPRRNWISSPLTWSNSLLRPSYDLFSLQIPSIASIPSLFCSKSAIFDVNLLANWIRVQIAWMSNETSVAVILFLFWFALYLLCFIPIKLDAAIVEVAQMENFKNRFFVVSFTILRFNRMFSPEKINNSR